MDPARIREFFARGVEGFDDPVGKENQGVAAAQLNLRRGKGGLLMNAKRQTAGFEALDGAVGAADHGSVMAGVDISELPSDGIEFPDDRGGKALAAEAVVAGVMVEALRELIERSTFGSDGAKAGLQRGHEKSRRDTLAGDIGHNEHELAGIVRGF